MFDPTIGRWLEEDPMGFNAGDPNLYRYVFNAPSGYTDPSGLLTSLIGAPPGLLAEVGLAAGATGLAAAAANQRLGDPVGKEVNRRIWNFRRNLQCVAETLLGYVTANSVGGGGGGSGSGGGGSAAEGGGGSPQLTPE